MLPSLWKLLKVIPVIFFLGLVHTYILFVAASFIDLQLVVWGVNKTLAMAVALGVAVGCHLFIVFNHKIRAYANQWRDQ